MTEPVICATELNRRFGDVVAVREVHLTLRAGEMALLLGRSGAGKTTLLGLLSGLDRPDSGRIVVAGQDLAELDSEARAALLRRSLGWVFQAAGLLPFLTAAENVALSLELTGVHGGEAMARARAMLAQLGLAARSEHRPHELSGGERQRVAIARALVKEPLVLFCDEPTGQLDTQAGTMAMGLLRDAADGGVAVLVATHDEDARALADLVLRMEDGVLTVS